MTKQSVMLPTFDACVCCVRSHGGLVYNKIFVLMNKVLGYKNMCVRLRKFSFGQGEICGARARELFLDVMLLNLINF